MLSRAANSIYWMNRYLERADNVARFIAVNMHLSMDMDLDRQATQWAPLVHASGDYKDFNSRYDEPNETNVVRFLIFDPENANSIISCVKNARENARTLQETISSEVWETINALYHYVMKQGRKRHIEDLEEFLIQIRRSNHLFAGRLDNTMSHNEAWRFARIGRLLERADKMARLLDVKYFILLPNPSDLNSPQDTVEWGAVLKSVGAFEAYRKQYHQANYRDVAQFLIFDPLFPRAIYFCVRSVSTSLAHITDMLDVRVQATDEIKKLQSMLDSTDIDTVLQNGLHEFIDTFQFNLNVVDNSLYKSFFSLEPK